MKTKELILIGLFASIIAISTFIKIPIGPVPITLQLPAILLTGFLLGSKRASYSVLIYILVGLVGIPVFSFGGGLSSVLSPTFGFVIGFIFAAMIVGQSHRFKINIPLYIFLSICAIGVTYIFGVVHFYIIMNFVLDTPYSLVGVLQVAVIPFAIKDIISAIITVFLAISLTKVDIGLNECQNEAV